MSKSSDTPIERCDRHYREFRVADGCPFCRREMMVRLEAAYRRRNAEMASYLANPADLSDADQPDVLLGVDSFPRCPGDGRGSLPAPGAADYLGALAAIVVIAALVAWLLR